MNLFISHDKLLELVKQQAHTAIEAKQVADRLRKFFPERLFEIMGGFLRSERITKTRAMRHAVIDPQYIQHVNELVQVASEARAARVQYETHLMLIEARKSLRRYRQKI